MKINLNVKSLLVSLIFLTYSGVLCFSFETPSTFLEADFIKDYSGDGKFKISGHAIVKRNSALFNADEIEILKDKDNIDTQNKTKDTFIFKANNWVKARTSTDNLIFAKSMLYRERDQSGYFNNAQFFPRQKHGNTLEIYATKLEKQNHIYTFKNLTICPCKILTDENIEHNKKNPFYLIKGLDNVLEDEFIEKPLGHNSIDNTDKEMHDNLQKGIISFTANKATYNTKTNDAIFEKLKMKIFGLTVFYWPFNFKLNTNKKGNYGFLMPNFIFLGFRQFGFEIPFYSKLTTDMDFFISRSQYFNFGKLYGFNDSLYLNTNDNQYKLKDLDRKRNSTTQIRFRHLISNKHNYNSFYTISAMLIDSGQLLDSNTGLGKIDESGKPVKNFRWFVDLQSKIKLSETTFLHADINFASDRNVSYYYMQNTKLIQENKIHLYDVTENRYLSAELYNYQSRLLPIEKSITPIVFPILQGNYHFPKDKIGGNFYINGKSLYIPRKEGYNTFVSFLDFGYHLPFFLKKGTKISVDTMIRAQYGYFKYKPLTTTPYSPLQLLTDNSIFYYGNYAWFSTINNSYTDVIKNRYSGISFYSFNKLQIEHPFLIISKFGNTIINPKIALRYSPNHGKNIIFPAEDNMLMHFNYYNAFDLMQSSGFGLYDTGLSLVYGYSFKHKFNKNYEFFGGLVNNFRITNTVEENILPEYIGFRRKFSDIIGEFGIKLYNFTANGYFNYDIYNKELRNLSVFGTSNFKYLKLSIGYSFFSKNATIFGYNFDMFSAYIDLHTPRQTLKFFGGIQSNLRDMITIDGYKKPNIISYTGGIAFRLGCIELGFEITKINFVLINMRNNTMFKVIFNFLGFG